MAAPPLSDEEIIETINTVREYGSIYGTAKATGIPRGTIQARLKTAALRGLLDTKPTLPGFVLKQTSTQYDEHGRRKKEWIQQKPEPGEEFEVPEGHTVRGVSALVDSEGRAIQQWIKTRADQNPQFLEAIKAAFDTYTGAAKPIQAPKRTDEDLLSVYPIADQHNGLLAWGQETGESYDLNIGADRLRTCMARLVAQSPPSKQAVILNLGDWQHTDDQRNATPKSGYALDVDGRYFKVLTVGVQLMMDCIELALRKHETVIVRNIPGNHDPHSSIALTVALAAFYAREKRVVIDDDPSSWWFYRFGETLLGANHGDKAKADKMAMFLATERREDWGATRYHHILVGHIHHEVVREVGDVRVESFQSLASRDAYATSHAYSSGRSLTSITYHISEGEIGRHRINVPLLVNQK
jgi:hypothetical protein